MTERLTHPWRKTPFCRLLLNFKNKIFVIEPGTYIMIVLEERKYNNILKKNKRRAKHGFLAELEPFFLKGARYPTLNYLN